MKNVYVILTYQGALNKSYHFDIINPLLKQFDGKNSRCVVVNYSGEKIVNFETYFSDQKDAKAFVREVNTTAPKELYALGAHVIATLADKEYEQFGDATWVRPNAEWKTAGLDKMREIPIEQITRPSPSESATLFDEGVSKKGNDGNTWVIALARNKTKRWVHA